MRLPAQQPGLSPIRVVIADPSTMLRGLITNGLKRHSRFRVIGSVGRPDELLHLLEQSQPDVALISETAQDGPFNGLLLLSQIHGAYPKVGLIVLIDRSEPEVVVQAFRSGAKGVFVRSESDLKALCKCVECVHGGQIWATTQDIKHLLNALIQGPRMGVADSKGFNLLSKREEDVVRLLAEGMSNREISKALELSEHTVKNYLFKVFDKLGLSSRTELVLYALSCAQGELPQFEPTGTLEGAPRSSVRSPDTAETAGPSKASRVGTGKRIKPARRLINPRGLSNIA